MSATTSLRRPGGDADAEPRVGRIRHGALVLTVVVVVVGCVLATWLVAFSSVLGVRTVTVLGEHRLSAAQVRDAAQITDGTPLVRLDTDRVRSRVQALPDVASASVTRSFPATVTITVTERIAVGVVRTGSGFMLVDRTGDQFRGASRRPARLPLFAVPQGTQARLTAAAVATVAAALPAKLRARIASIQALDPSTITLLLKGGRLVRWGSADRSADKARVLPALLREPGAQFDLTNPDQPFSR